MSEPTTAAGRALSVAALHYQSGRWLEPESIAAIEAEAAAAERTALAAELDALTWGRVFPGEARTTRELVVFQKTVGHIRRVLAAIHRDAP